MKIMQATGVFEGKVFNSTAKRLQEHVKGVELDYSDVYGMLGQCACELSSCPG